MVIHRIIPQHTKLVVYKAMMDICSTLRKLWAGHYRMTQPFLYDRPFHNDRVYLNSLISDICPRYYMVSYTEIQYILYTNQWSSICSKLWKPYAGHYRIGHQCLYERPFRNDRVYLISRVFIIWPGIKHGTIAPHTEFIVYKTARQYW